MACQPGEENLELNIPGEENLNPSHSYRFDVSARNRFPEPGEGSQVSRRAPEEQHKGIPVTPVSKLASLGAQLKCFYKDARSVGYKQEKLEICSLLRGCDLIGIMETWWVGFCHWSDGLKGLKCMELCLRMDEDLTKSLWIRSKGRAGIADILVRVCYRPPNQEDQMDELYTAIHSYTHRDIVSLSQAVVLMGDFMVPTWLLGPNHSSSFWYPMWNTKG